MHSKDSFDLYFLARGEGMSVRDAAELAGVPERTCDGWERGRVPRAYGWAACDAGNIGAERRALFRAILILPTWQQALSAVAMKLFRNGKGMPTS